MKKRQKEEGGASVYFLSGYVLVLMLIIWICGFHLKTLRYVRDDFDAGLLSSLLGAAIINIEEYGASGSRVIHDTYTGEGDIWGAVENASINDEHLELALQRVRELLQTNLNLAADGSSAKNVVVSPVKLEEFRVFNVYEQNERKQIYEFFWKNGSWSVITHAVDEKVYVAGAGDRGTKVIEITDTTVYAKIGFEVAVFPYYAEVSGMTENERDVKVYMQRSVSIPRN